MDKFLSCDWGTSRFRLRLVRTADLSVIAEEKDDRGISVTHQSWKRVQNDQLSRVGFYSAVIAEHIQRLSLRLGFSLSGIPIVLSGMASSSIGLLEIPYKELPVSIDGSDLSVEILGSELDDHQFIVISGVRTDRDVMRGEETKVVGCSAILQGVGSDQLLIFPGTHSKHVIISNGSIVGFKSFLTGEWFELLSTAGILSVSVAAGGDFSDPTNQEWFESGVKASQAASLLHNAFTVRTNELLRHVPPQQNYYYLSGLLIGDELRNIEASTPVYLVGGKIHQLLYAHAFRTLGIPIAHEIDADLALIRGQCEVLCSCWYC